jgi:hypothetical protein
MCPCEASANGESKISLQSRSQDGSPTMRAKDASERIKRIISSSMTNQPPLLTRRSSHSRPSPANDNGYPLRPRLGDSGRSRQLRRCTRPDRCWWHALSADPTHRESTCVSARESAPRAPLHGLNSFRQTSTSSRVIANFYIGSRITALAWSTRCTSPSTTDEWSIECVHGLVYAQLTDRDPF